MSPAAIKIIAQAYAEMNAIRARDGAPSGVCHEYWNSIVEGLDQILREETQRGGHCHPSLYQNPTQRKEEVVILTRNGKIGKVITEGKRRIKQNIWGNWKGYVSNRKVMDFGTDESEAMDWLAKRETPKPEFTMTFRRNTQ